ncbi:MAG: MBL fold metallo-hydrolase [Ruminococcaceae bacterium]|nr:MBL fold metallo-hydrolase [Oscillospiraceae bacterium]
MSGPFGPVQQKEQVNETDIAWTGWSADRNRADLHNDRPYLLDTLHEQHGEALARIVPPTEKYINMHPDMVLITHDHGDHMDLPSLRRILDTDKQVQVLAAANAWARIRFEIGKGHNYIAAYRGVEWTYKDVHIRTVPAVHSDTTAVGFVIHAEGKTLYITGDTLYDEAVIASIGEPVDILYTVMNGLGNNMNATNAARFAAKLQPKVAVPVHWGLFEKFSAPPELFL